MTNVPSLSALFLWFFILAFMPFLTAFIIYYIRFAHIKRSALAGLFAIVLMALLLIAGFDEGYSTLAAGIVAGAGAIFAYPPSA